MSDDENDVISYNAVIAIQTTGPGYPFHSRFSYF